MMSLHEAVGLCFGSGIVGWCVSLGFYLLRRYANIVV